MGTGIIKLISDLSVNEGCHILDMTHIGEDIRWVFYVQ